MTNQILENEPRYKEHLVRDWRQLMDDSMVTISRLMKQGH